MTANPDALRRAADEVAELLRQDAEHRKDIERLSGRLSEYAVKIQAVRDQLARAGFPVNEGDWPTKQLRALVDAYLVAHPARAVVGESLDLLSAAGLRSGDIRDRLRTLIADRAALLAADAPMTAELIAILGGACLPSEIVGRVRSLVADNTDLARRLEVAQARVAELERYERIVKVELRDESAALEGFSKSDCKYWDNDYATLERRRHGWHWWLKDEPDTEGNHVLALVAMEAARDAHAARTDALRAPKVMVVEWRGSGGRDLFVGDEFVAQVTVGLDGKPWRLLKGISWIGHATNETSARKLAELLGGADPGGVWRLSGHAVPVDVVRLVCPTVAVTWSAE